MAVGLWVVRRRYQMMDTPPLQEVLKVTAGKLRSTVSPEAEGNTNFSKIAAEDPYGVGGSSIAFTRNDDRPPRESINNDEERLPCDLEEIG